jgi:excisionase family DNA binding protein
MARIFDVIEYPNEMRDEIVHRFPEVGAGNFRIGSQVIVRESQNAIFSRDGKALDKFGPGRHTITTANIPLLINIVEKVFDNRTPFPAEVYFVSMREFVNRKWGTPQPIIVRNPNMGLGVALLQGFGSYSFQVSDPQQFVNQVVGARGVYRIKLGETAASQSVPELIGLTEELGAGVRAKAQDDFLALGIILKSFYIENLKPSSKSAEELRAMGMLDMQTYTQLQAADALRDAAQNPSGGAGLTAGIGAGVGVGQVIRDSLGGMTGGTGTTPRQTPPTGGAPTGGAASVMTPSEAAVYLRVAEEDIVSAIESGDLKARKIGSAFRISKQALDEFLSG